MKTNPSSQSIGSWFQSHWKEVASVTALTLLALGSLTTLGVGSYGLHEHTFEIVSPEGLGLFIGGSVGLILTGIFTYLYLSWKKKKDEDNVGAEWIDPPKKNEPKPNQPEIRVVLPDLVAPTAPKKPPQKPEPPPNLANPPVMIPQTPKPKPVDPQPKPAFAREPNAAEIRELNLINAFFIKLPKNSFVAFKNNDFGFAVAYKDSNGEEFLTFYPTKSSQEDGKRALLRKEVKLLDGAELLRGLS